MSLKQQIKLLESQLSDDRIDSIISTLRKENGKYVLRLKFGSVIHNEECDVDNSFKEIQKHLNIL